MFCLNDSVRILPIPRNSVHFSLEKMNLFGKVLKIVGVKFNDPIFGDLFAVKDNDKVEWFTEKYLVLDVQTKDKKIIVSEVIKMKPENSLEEKAKLFENKLLKLKSY